MQVAQVAWAISHTTIRLGLHSDRSRPETGANSDGLDRLQPLKRKKPAVQRQLFYKVQVARGKKLPRLTKG